MAEFQSMKHRIHGGAFTAGAGTDLTYDGGAFASRGDVVVGKSSVIVPLMLVLMHFSQLR
jgi:hypothetical protein